MVRLSFSLTAALQQDPFEHPPEQPLKRLPSFVRASFQSSTYATHYASAFVRSLNISNAEEV